jgi:hypothetical protein
MSEGGISRNRIFSKAAEDILCLWKVLPQARTAVHVFVNIEVFRIQAIRASSIPLALLDTGKDEI